jgi:hypothetical protein
MSAMYHARVARSLRRVALWVLATGLAVLISWFGVERALPSGAIADVPRTVTVDRSGSPSATPLPVETSSPASATPPPTAAGSPATSASSAVAGRSTQPAAAPPTASDTDIQTYQLTGGRVVLEMAPASARLVSAIPDQDWRVQAWQADGWLRVDFSRGDTTSSCFVTWNGHAPTVQTT